MSYIFVVENRIVKPQVETLMVPVFREIWERDENPGKFNAMSEFSYIEFMVSKKQSNPYRGYPPGERHIRLAREIMGHEAYEPDELVKKAMEWLGEHQIKSSASMRFYLSAITAAKKLEDFFNTFDMNAINPKTMAPMFKPKEITSALADTSTVLQKLSELDEKVQNELYESGKNKGGKTVSPFADPDTL